MNYRIVETKRTVANKLQITNLKLLQFSCDVYTNQIYENVDHKTKFYGIY